MSPGNLFLGIDRMSPGLRLGQSFRGYFDVYNLVGIAVVIARVPVQLQGIGN